MASLPASDSPPHWPGISPLAAMRSFSLFFAANQTHVRMTLAQTTPYPTRIHSNTRGNNRPPTLEIFALFVSPRLNLDYSGHVLVPSGKKKLSMTRSPLLPPALYPFRVPQPFLSSSLVKSPLSPRYICKPRMFPRPGFDSTGHRVQIRDGGESPLYFFRPASRRDGTSCHAEYGLMGVLNDDMVPRAGGTKPQPPKVR